MNICTFKFYYLMLERVHPKTTLQIKFNNDVKMNAFFEFPK